MHVFTVLGFLSVTVAVLLKSQSQGFFSDDWYSKLIAKFAWESNVFGK